MTNKPYVEEKDFEPGTSEEKFYETCKKNFMLRNDSFIQDLFYGRFRSMTTCPTCKHVSLKFEPFSMLSLPIPSSNKDSHMTVTFYYVNDMCLYDLVKVECNVIKEATLRNIRDGFTKAKKQSQDSMNFYYYNGRTYEWQEVDDLDQQLVQIKFPENHFFFLMQDKTKNLGDSDLVHLCFKIDGLDPEKVVGIRKLIKTSKQSQVADLYRFYYDCLKQTFDSKIEDFDRCFSSKDPKRRLFDLFKGNQHLTFESDIPGSLTVDIADYDEIAVKILNEGIFKHKKLNALGTLLSERYPEDRVISLINCFESLTNPEKLDEENKWYCEKCKDHRQANFQLSIKELPPILIIHLKRFKKTSSMSPLKLTDIVDFPLDNLKLADYTSDPKLQANNCTYSLFGMINHSGNASYGHYTSVVRNMTNPNQWIYCDDENVVELKPNAFPAKDRSYILFYRKDGMKATIAQSTVQF